MIEALSILKDTPIPTLMVLGGIALLVLSVATRISDKIEISPERQQGAWIAGLILVVIGSLLFVFTPNPAPPEPIPIPTISPTSTTPPSNTPGLLICSQDPYHFIGHWQALASQLGCPINKGSGEMTLTYLDFERGRMVRRDPNGLIYALLNDNSYHYRFLGVCD